MLDFYGGLLVDEATGAVERSHHYEERFRNLCTFQHNFLRITRILKCLGELGHEHFQWPLIEFFMHEVFGTRALLPCRKSLLEFWAPSLRSTAQRDFFAAAIGKLNDQESRLVPEIVGGPKLIDIEGPENDGFEEFLEEWKRSSASPSAPRGPDLAIDEAPRCLIRHQRPFYLRQPSQRQCRQGAPSRHRSLTLHWILQGPLRTQEEPTRAILR